MLSNLWNQVYFTDQTCPHSVSDFGLILLPIIIHDKNLCFIYISGTCAAPNSQYPPAKGPITKLCVYEASDAYYMPLSSNQLCDCKPGYDYTIIGNLRECRRKCATMFSMGHVNNIPIMQLCSEISRKYSVKCYMLSWNEYTSEFKIIHWGTLFIIPINL